MVPGLEIPFDRVTYRDGQVLTASDMQADQTRNARLWQLHTRYLHDTWGIATGFEISGNAGDSIVQVGPGYAVDDQGRPLVSAHTVPIPLPLVSGTAHQVLVMNYQSDDAFRDRVGFEALCLGGGAAVQEEAPAFLWKAAADVRPGTDIPLVTVQVTNGAIQSSDSRARRYVHKLLRPYIAAGATDQGRTQWNVIQGAVPTGFTLYQTSIDTSDGAFNNAPFYFPELHMWSQAPAAIYGVTNSSQNQDSQNQDFIDFNGPFTFLTSPTSTSFVFNLLMPPLGASNVIDPNQEQWTVSWVGIEVAQCGPQFHLLIGILLNFQRFFPRFAEVAKFL